MNLKKIIIPFVIIIAGFLYGYDLTGLQKYIIYDTAVTTDDTLTSGWVTIGTSQNVAIFYSTDDTSYVKGSFEYRYGSGTAISSVAADTLSLDTRSSTAAGLSKGKVLRGYGLAADLIPGANQVKVTMIYRAGSETTTEVRVGLIAE